MGRTRWIVICTAALLAQLTTFPHRAAAGGSTFDFHRRWFAPGQLAEGKAQFSDWVGAQGRVAQGPYFAYLVRGDRFIEPPHLPRNAIRLGRVKMTHVEGTIWEAAISFVVPRIRPGGFMITLCNDPCRNTSVGDLVGAWISIAATAEQAKMRNLEARITERISQQTAEMTSDLYSQLEQLREAVAADQSRSITVGTELRIEPIEQQLARMSAEVRKLKERSDQELVAWLWLGGWVVAAGIVILWRTSAVRRRRTARIPPPSETAPSDEVTWDEVSPPMYDEEIWQPDRRRGPGELVSR